MNGLSQIQVFASSICNLSCKYCYLQDQHENSVYAILNKEIQEAWINGSYVTNIKKVLEKFDSNPEKLKVISFWGGEPLLLVKNLINPIKELLDFFPNVTSTFFSTNFYKIENLIDLIYAVDNSVNHNINLVLQLSIDAPPGELQTKGHQVDWNIYRQNITSIFKDINNRGGLQHLKIIFVPHATLSWDDIKLNLSTYNDIKKYCDYFYDFYKFILEQAKIYQIENNILVTRKTIFPTIAEPARFSVEDGIRLNSILQLLNFIQHEEKYNKDMHLYRDFFYSIEPELLFDNNPTCLTNGEEGATILPDGTVSSCFCDYILNTPQYWDWIKDNPIKRKEYRQAILKHRLYLNPINATEQEKLDYEWYIYDNIKVNTSTSSHLISNLIIEMAKSGQIDYIYYQNLNSLINHLTQFSHDSKCPNDQLRTVFSTHLVSVDYLRKYFNGGSMLAQNNYKEDELWKKKWN